MMGLVTLGYNVPRFYFWENRWWEAHMADAHEERALLALDLYNAHGLPPAHRWITHAATLRFDMRDIETRSTTWIPGRGS
jgi:hypothetical protein